MKKLSSLIAIFIIILANTSFAAYPADLEEQELKALENNGEFVADNKEFVTMDETPEQENGMIYSDIYRAEENVNIDDYNVDGNAYITGADVKIKNSTIYGNLYVLGKNVEIEQTDIQGSIFVACETINFDGLCNDLYVAAKDVIFGQSSSIGRDAKIATQNIKIDGYTGRNFNLYAQNIEIAETTVISSNFKYSSGSEVVIPEETQISNIEFDEKIEEENIKLEDVNDVLSAVVKTVIIAVIVVFLISKFKNIKREESVKEYVASFGKGLLALIVVPVISVMCIIIPFTAVFGAIFIAIYAISLMIASSFFAVEISYRIANKQNKTDNKIIIGYAAVISLILALISIVPGLGGICKFLAFTIGLGFLVNLIYKKV